MKNIITGEDYSAGPFINRPHSGRQTPFLFTVPHSGRHYPANFVKNSRLGAHDLRLSEDAFVDLLLEDIPGFGAQMIIATFARSYVDLNRSPDELDAAMFHPPLSFPTLDRTARVRGGLGVIPAIVAQGVPIYDNPLPAREAAMRLDTVYNPYHGQIRKTADTLKRKFGQVYIIDCHSMPSDMLVTNKQRDIWSGLSPSKRSPDIILGDAWGESCDPALTAAAEKLFITAGFSVRRNVPYAGGYATRRYGCPREGVHALQIEICRSLYMNETTIEPTPTFHETRARLTHVLAGLIATLSNTVPLAAE